ncbi:hypothetical protein [Polynucleobacter cosmopolitanus]|uniref:Uncharacterized protein n=1 Tax=Polynucleobacter cosmopolitanus TaxID=351345 RepID=A0A229FTI2_9BURK|nr:hypothetical protein [Polynucleobacter cosmopolitanus]OXL15193.1 hypothetical protein AOC33_07810 [Polynucleobacter cosmopolitanus]
MNAYEKILKNTRALNGLKNNFKKSFCNFQNLIANNKRWVTSVLFISVALFYLFFMAHLPISLYTTSNHDDALFIKNAMSIAHGEWLGAYNNLTLAKGVAFPFFLSLSSFTGLPITFMLGLLNLAAIYLLIFELRRLISNKTLLLFLALILIFHPALMPTRITRDFIYPAFALFLIAGLIRASHHDSEKDSLLSICAYGFLGGWFFLIREEGIWITPLLIAIIVYRYLILRPSGKIYHPTIKSGCIFILCLLIPTAIVSSVNYVQYGRFVTQEFTNGHFIKVLGQLNSVVDKQDTPYIPVSEKKRALIYKVSPSFRELKPFLEGDLKVWQESGCAIYPHTCGDYAGGWFMWAFRDAVARKGYYQSTKTAEDFYRQLGNEITKACREGLLSCQSNLLPVIPSIPKENFSLIIPKLNQAIKNLLVINPTDLTAGPSLEPRFLLEQYRDFLGYPRITPTESESDFQIKGWFYGPTAANQGAWLELICTDGYRNLRLAIAREQSPDLIKFFKDSRASMQRFTVQISGDLKCSFASTDSRSLLPQNLISNKGGAYPLGLNTLFIDQKIPSPTIRDHHNTLSIKERITSNYRWVVIPLIIIGLISFFIATIICLFIKKKWPSFLYVLSLALWGVIALRMLILMIIELSSFPGITILYMLPIYPMIIIVSCLSMWLLFTRDFCITPAFKKPQ